MRKYRCQVTLYLPGNMIWLESVKRYFESDSYYRQQDVKIVRFMTFDPNQSRVPSLTLLII